MASYGRVYGFGHLRADYRGPGSATEPLYRVRDSFTLYDYLRTYTNAGS